MKTVVITPIKRNIDRELIEKYENPLTSPCEVVLNKEYISKDARIPNGFCSEAWHSIEEYVVCLAKGEVKFPGWMKDPTTAVVSCNDGLRTVIFLLKSVD